MNEPLELRPSEFVALLNQTLEYAYPNVVLTGELANFRVSKNQWVYFDLKDETASVKCFGTVYQLPGPLEDGMLVKLRGVPKLHPLYGFSVTIQRLALAGEGSIKKAAQMLEAKLKAEGLFDVERKRPLPYPPKHIGLITSGESAAFKDFMKILEARWRGVRITLIDVQVQGEPAVQQIVGALEQFNAAAETPDVIVVTRGGGSAEDLQAFSTEQVTRAVAASRIPTIVAIGHEVDVSLAELAADRRASTPSNAAELLVPDRAAELVKLQSHATELERLARAVFAGERATLKNAAQMLEDAAARALRSARERLNAQRQLLAAFHPETALRRGFALARREGTLITRAAQAKAGDVLELEFSDGNVTAEVKQTMIKAKEKK
ncbi:MAG TPA: exodeoxyribonuclease VII large subunit [Candidatus Saccharimonadales bacterium]